MKDGCRETTELYDRNATETIEGILQNYVGVEHRIPEEYRAFFNSDVNGTTADYNITAGKRSTAP